ncbi:GTP-binding protein REM 1 [Papilio machaon]|uniref:GTP-binding protein REM 1 n=1 Tax=Papilio machaon TaxID=76193 RepID=A0A0N0PEB3_PAPMA|nr:GTP-binding protein REM 1 [Papilio machaon]
MAVNSPGGYPPLSPKPLTPKSPRHFIFPQRSPSINSSTSSSGYFTPQSGCSYDKHNPPPKSPIAHGHRSPMSPRHFNFPQKIPSGRSSPCNFDRVPHGLHYTTSLKHGRREKSRSPKPPPVHIHTNPGYVSPNRGRKLYGSTSTVSSPRLVTSPSIVSSHTDDSTDAMPGTPSAIVHDADDEATTTSSRICRKSTSDLTDLTDDTPCTRSTSISRPCSPMRRGSMKGGLAYLASRRGSRESTMSNCDSVEDIGPLNFQNTMRGRQRRTSNFLELPVVEHARPRVCSLPEKPYNPRLSDDLYRLRTFSITTKGGVVNCGDSICNRRSRSNTSVNSTNSRASDRSPFDGSCCSGYRPVDSGSLTTPDEDDLDPIPKYRVVLLGDAGVGKTALVSQFMTSEYMNTYDASLENCLSTYEPHACVVVYSVVARSSFTRAAELLQYLAREQFTVDRTVVLVGNKADLARARQVTTNEGKALATTRDCKFIETSSGIQHNVDELLVGILKQIRLKENRDKKQAKKVNKQDSKSSKLASSRTHISLNIARELLQKICINDISKSKSCENLHVL